MVLPLDWGVGCGAVVGVDRWKQGTDSAKISLVWENHSVKSQVETQTQVNSTQQ